MIALLLAFAVQAGPPTHEQYVEEAEALGRAALLGGVCAGLGLVKLDSDALDQVVLDFNRRTDSIEDERGLLTGAIERGGKRELATIERLLDMGADDGSERRRRREAQMVEYFRHGCAELMRNYPSAYTIAGER